MNIQEIQKKVHEYISQYDEFYWPPLGMLAALIEEIGEVSRNINALEGIKPLKKGENNIDDLKSSLATEIADSLFATICIANYYEIDIEKAILKTIEKYNKRDQNRWTKVEKKSNTEIKFRF